MRATVFIRFVKDSRAQRLPPFIWLETKIVTASRGYDTLWPQGLWSTCKPWEGFLLHGAKCVTSMCGRFKTWASTEPGSSWVATCSTKRVRVKTAVALHACRLDLPTMWPARSRLNLYKKLHQRKNPNIKSQGLGCVGGSGVALGGFGGSSVIAGI